MLQKANQNLPINDVGIHRTQMQKEIILQKLKERGCRITRQRKMLLDVILNEDCSSCKEIYYKASMKDSGIGIPAESIKKIWDRFYKTDLSRGKDKRGTGLGLAIVKEIIQAHNEHINVISTEGVGTEFIFTLPLAKKEVQS